MEDYVNACVISVLLEKGLYELLASKIPRQSAHPRHGRRSPQNRLSKISTLKSALQYIRHLKSVPARESQGCISFVASARHIEQLRFIVTDMPPKPDCGHLYNVIYIHVGQP